MYICLKPGQVVIVVWCAGQTQTQTLPMAGTRGNPANFFQHPAPLGSNLYDRDRVRVVPPAGRQLGPGGQAGSLSSIPTPESTSAEKASMRGDCATLLCCAVLYMPLVVCKSLPYQHSHLHACRVPSGTNPPSRSRHEHSCSYHVELATRSLLYLLRCASGSLCLGAQYYIQSLRGWWQGAEGGTSGLLPLELSIVASSTMKFT